MTDHVPPDLSPITDTSDSTRIVLECTVCGAAINIPNNDLGRPFAAAWRTQHQHDKGSLK